MTTDARAILAGAASHPERLLAFKLDVLGLPAGVEQYRFHPTRRWRFDRAWPEQLVALEIDGGTWTGGRHTRGKGYEQDAEKINAATLLGWRVYRVTPDMVNDGRAVALIRAALGKE